MMTSNVISVPGSLKLLFHCKIANVALDITFTFQVENEEEE